VVVRSRTGGGGGPRDELAEALEIYDGLGAGWAARRAVGRLRSLGVRTSGSSARRSGTGRSALTATELRVADLVVQGLSSPEAAERLSLSRRTVETHVAHIMAKVGVRSRREIAAALQADPPD
jgi:DNA-binding CsgD family transcriptional regulator